MLYILYSFLLILPVWWGFGSIFQQIFGELWEGVSAKVISGMLLLMVVWHVLAFFIPINQYVEWGSLAIGWVLFFYNKGYQHFEKLNKKEWSLWSGLVLVSALVGSGYPFILDHFGYYVPSVKWLSEFGLVKGISNWEWVLGQMSPWHILQSGFSHFSDEFLRLNVLLLAVFFLYALEQKSWAMFIFSSILFFFVQSPSPDLPSVVFSLMILNEVLRKNQSFGLLFAFSVLVFSIKPTMLWVPILTFFYPLWVFGKGLKFIRLGVFIGMLYVVKNLWVFGYPLFPIEFLDLGVSWKPYSGLFVESARVAVGKTFDLQYSLEEIAQFSVWDYFWNWLTLKGIKGIINTSFILSIMLLGVYTWKKKNKILTLVFISVLIKSLFVLWFSAQYRFFIEIFFVVFVVISAEQWNKKTALGLFSAGAILVAGCLFSPKKLQEQVPSFNVGFFMKGFRWKQLYRPSHYVFNQYETYQLGDLVFHVPKNYELSFDVVLPNIPLGSLKEFLQMGIFPQKISKDLGDGFIWRYLSQEEKKELEQIIKEIENKKKDKR